MSTAAPRRRRGGAGAVELAVDDAYRGADRRSMRRVTGRCYAGTWALAIVGVAVVATVAAPSGPNVVPMAGSSAVTLALLVGALACFAYRTIGDERLVTTGVGLLTLGLGPVVVAGYLPAAIRPDEASVLGDSLLAALPAVAILALAPFGPAIDTRSRVRWRVVAAGMASVVLAAAVGAPGFSRRLDAAAHDRVGSTGLVVLALVGLVIAGTFAWRGRRDHADLMLSLGLVPFGAACGAFAAGLVGHRAAFAAFLVAMVGLVGAGQGIARRMLAAHQHERRRVLAALARAEVLESRQRHDAISRELAHELKAGLLMLEGGVLALAADRAVADRGNAAGADAARATADAVVSELGRLRAMLAPNRAERVETYAVGDALAPVLTCARASGMDITAEVAGDVTATGDPAVTAQVVLGLLANVRRHASGSPVALACGREGGEVVLRVADRGTGLAPEVRDRLFEPGVRASGSEGNGLGLAVARHLVEGQRGHIAVVDGVRGTTVELRLPAARTT